MDYRGHLATTAGGLACQRWASHAPHAHAFTEEYFPDAGLGGNHSFCRNPNGLARPWCFTTDPNVTAQFCDVPDCRVQHLACVPSTGPDSDGRAYVGALSTDRNGRACRPWEPALGGRGLEGTSACRNPAPDRYVRRSPGARAPRARAPHRGVRAPRMRTSTHFYSLVMLALAWRAGTARARARDVAQAKPVCVIAPGQTSECAVPACPAAAPASMPGVGCWERHKSAYRGALNVTASGRPCQRWSASRPHAHGFAPAAHADAGLGEHNYCRMPESVRASRSPAPLEPPRPFAVSRLVRTRCTRARPDALPVCARALCRARAAMPCGASPWIPTWSGSTATCRSAGRCATCTTTSARSTRPRAARPASAGVTAHTITFLCTALATCSARTTFAETLGSRGRCGARMSVLLACTPALARSARVVPRVTPARRATHRARGSLRPAPMVLHGSHRVQAVGVLRRRELRHGDPSVGSEAGSCSAHRGLLCHARLRTRVPGLGVRLGLALQTRAAAAPAQRRCSCRRQPEDE